MNERMKALGMSSIQNIWSIENERNCKKRK